MKAYSLRVLAEVSFDPLRDHSVVLSTLPLSFDNVPAVFCTCSCNSRHSMVLGVSPVMPMYS